jgi:hypothetical protein
MQFPVALRLLLNHFRPPIISARVDFSEKFMYSTTFAVACPIFNPSVVTSFIAGVSEDLGVLASILSLCISACIS